MPHEHGGIQLPQKLNGGFGRENINWEEHVWKTTRDMVETQNEQRDKETLRPSSSFFGIHNYLPL